MFFPSGFIAFTFPLLVPCHMYIYALDHWRVLRGTPRRWFSGQQVDYAANVLVAVIVGFIPVCIIFKTAWMNGGPSGSRLLLLMLNAYMFHMLMHLKALNYVYAPKKSQQKPIGESYKHVAQTTPSSHFS